MELDNYQSLAMRTYNEYPPRLFSSNEQTLLLGSLGLAGESGEFVEHIKKIFFHNKEIPDEKLQLELGDILWYIAAICHAKNWNLSDICQMNIAKLEKRYPNGFSFVDALKRVDLNVKL